MASDIYNRPIVSMWIQGSQLFDLRAMIKVAVKEFDNKFMGNKSVCINDRFNCELSSRIYKKSVDQYGVVMMSREKGYLVSMVAPDPTKSRNIQIYAKLYVAGARGVKGHYQEVMHFIYHPATDNSPSHLVELRYVPDASGSVVGS